MNDFDAFAEIALAIFVDLTLLVWFLTHLERTLVDPYPNLLQPAGVVAGGEPVGQRGPADAGHRGLPFRPLMPVQPYLDRIRESSCRS